MLAAVIDVGTNSVKYLLAETCCGKENKVLKDIVIITRLGDGLTETGLINRQALLRTADAVSGFASDAKKCGAEDIRIVGTMALRTASNSADFSDRVRELAGIETVVLSGREEAALSFWGAVSGLDLREVRRYCTIDIGGGSTEIVFADEGKIVCSSSLKTGALFLTDKYFSKEVLSEKDIIMAENELKTIFNGLKPPFRISQTIGIGGNVAAMASVFKRMERYDPEEIHGVVLTESEIDRQITEYLSNNREERRKIKGLDPERADIILAGACIIRYSMRSCGCSEIVVSERGLRHGILRNIFDCRQPC